MRHASLIIIAFFLFCFGFYACDTQKLEKPAEGFVTVHGKKLWYKVYGTGHGMPVVMMHGGPGFPSYYLSPLAEQFAAERKVIIFDQISCGRSEKTDDTAYMSISSHIEQVDSLVSFLGLKNYYIYAHSYGTMLAMDYYLSHPQGIKGIIFASPCMNTKRWVTDADTLIQQLPDSSSQLIQAYIKRKPTDSVKLAKAIDLYFNTYYNRKQPIPPAMDSAIKNSGQKMYTYMWDEYDFQCNGTLKDYNRIPDLPRIKVPVLFTCGEFDAARPVTVKMYQRLVPGAAFSMIPNSGHGTMGDQPEVNYKVVADFIHRLDKMQR